MRTAPVLIALTAIAARAVAQIALGFYAAPETWEYSEAAHSLVIGRGLVVEHNGAEWHNVALPVYPLLLASFEIVFGTSPVPVGIAQLALGAALAVIVYAIGLRLGTPMAGLLAGLGAATHPALVVYAAKVHSLNLDVVLSAAGVLCIFALGDTLTLKRGVALGLIAGTAALTRPTAAVATAASALVGLAGASPWRRWVPTLALSLIVASLVATPWMIRNYVELGRFGIAPTMGESLWRGNNRLAVHGTLAADGRPLLEADEAMREAVWGKDELEQDAIFTRSALAYIQEDILRAAGAVMRRFVVFWSFGELSGTQYPSLWFPLYMAYYAALAAFAILGAYTLFRLGHGRSAGILIAALLATSLTQSLFYVEGRHRWSVESFLILFAAVGAVQVLQVGRVARRPSMERAPGD